MLTFLQPSVISPSTQFRFLCPFLSFLSLTINFFYMSLIWFGMIQLRLRYYFQIPIVFLLSIYLSKLLLVLPKFSLQYFTVLPSYWLFLTLDNLLNNVRPLYDLVILLRDFNIFFLKNDHRTNKLLHIISSVNLHVLPFSLTHRFPNAS